MGDDLRLDPINADDKQAPPLGLARLEHGPRQPARSIAGEHPARDLLLTVASVDS